MAEQRPRLPERGEAWEPLREKLVALGRRDVDWRSKRSAVYVFHPGDDVLEVAKQAYALYQSENALGPAAFPSLRRMESDVVAIAIDLLHGPADATGNITSGGTESILLAVKSCRDAAAARGVEALGLEVYGDPQLALLAFGAADGDPVAIFAVWKGMHDRGWFSGVVQRPDGIHLMLSPAHDEVADRYLADLSESLEAARRVGGATAAPAPVRSS